MEAITNEDQDGKSFKDLYQKVPPLIPKQMAKNLSVPIAFVCILHLANEKVFFLFEQGSYRSWKEMKFLHFLCPGSLGKLPRVMESH